MPYSIEAISEMVRRGGSYEMRPKKQWHTVNSIKLLVINDRQQTYETMQNHLADAYRALTELSGVLTSAESDGIPVDDISVSFSIDGGTLSAEICVANRESNSDYSKRMLELKGLIDNSFDRTE